LEHFAHVALVLRYCIGAFISEQAAVRDRLCGALLCFAVLSEMKGSIKNKRSTGGLSIAM
jgi:hypothetical protein